MSAKKESGILILHNIQNENPVICKNLIHQVLTEHAKSSRDISGVHVLEVIELLEKQVGKRVNLPYELEAERTYEGIQIRKSKREVIEKITQKAWEIVPGETLEIPEYGYKIRTTILEKNFKNQEIPQKMYTKWLDYDKINGSMLLRTRQEKGLFYY